MSRMFSLNAARMCTKHLLAEHKTIHSLVSMIRAGKFSKIAKLARQGLVETRNIPERHEVLAEEIVKRKIRHKTPLMAFDPFDVGDVEHEESLHTLCSGCPDCAKGFAWHPGYIILPAQYEPSLPKPSKNGHAKEPENDFHFTGKKNWYAVAITPGYKEVNVKDEIYKLAMHRGLEDGIGRILIPSEKVTTLIRGKRVTKRQTKFTGYLICEVDWCRDIRYLFRDVEGTGFFLGRNENEHDIYCPKPTPLGAKEIEDLLLEEKASSTLPTKETPEARHEVVIPYAIGDNVLVKAGTFKDTVGKVKEIDKSDLSKDPIVTVTVLMLGTPTDLQLEYWKLTKEENV